MKWRRSKRVDAEIAPDEIFLDSANLTSFDRSRFEGRLERPLSSGAFYFAAGLLGFLFLILVAQSWNLQVRQGTAYAAESEHNSLSSQTLFAARGVITDLNGLPLAYNETSEDGSTTLRVYKTPGFAHLLGYVSYPKKDSKGNYYDTEMDGLAGLELSFNDALKGVNGSILVERDALGEVQSQGSVVAPKNGEDLKLSIDARAQEAFYQAVSTVADKVPFIGGAGILMDIHTGEIRALVSYPEYDPNVLSKGSPRDVIASYNVDSRKPYLDRAVSGLYTPGSIVKPLEAAAALTDGTITPDYTVNDIGYLSIPNPYDPTHPNIFKDWKAIGVEDMRKAIAWSSDVYFYIVGGGYQGQKGLGIERLAWWYRTYGLTSPTGIELPREASGFVPTPAWKKEKLGEDWRIGDTYHTAIGQYAMQVTPLEMARAIAAVANGGTLVKPTIVEATSSTPVGEKLPVDPAALQVAREGMRRGVTEGTSVGLNALSYLKAAGKTGTAQTGYHNEFYNAWAVGFFPYDDPKYVYAVVMEHGPAGNTTGGVFTMYQFFSKLHELAPEYFQ